MTTVRNPHIPFVVTIPGGPVNPGQVIIIEGEPLSDCNRFNVNVVCGAQPEVSDVALQINAHFDLCWLSRNSKLRKQWGEEENVATNDFPFRKKVPFTLEIYCSPTAFLVAVDGRHFCEYKHRAPLNACNTLQIQGQVRVTMVELNKSPVYPSTRSRLITVPAGLLNVSQPSIPFTAPINGPWPVGSEIRVQGRVKANPHRFHVNLQEGCLIHPHPPIALHLNPRFDGARRDLVLNSWFGQWGAELKIAERSNPFRPNKPFLLVIRRQVSVYEIFVDDVLVTVFGHRMSADMVDAVAIDGDVVLEKVNVS